MVLPTLSDIVMIWYRHPSVTLYIIWYRYPTATSYIIWCCHSSVTSYIIQCCLLSLTSNIIHWHHTLDCPTNPQWHCTSYGATPWSAPMSYRLTLYIIRCCFFDDIVHHTVSPPIIDMVHHTVPHPEVSLHVIQSSHSIISLIIATPSYPSMNPSIKKTILLEITEFQQWIQQFIVDNSDKAVDLASASLKQSSRTPDQAQNQPSSYPH